MAGKALSLFFSSPTLVFTAAGLLRAVFLLYGLWQDANSPVKYTDIDYLVFTDAARFTFSHHGGPHSSSQGYRSYGSPYQRETYRYTPLLAWLLYPTTLAGAATTPAQQIFLFSTGKILFSLADLAAGWLLLRMLTRPRSGGGVGDVMSTERALRFASLWLLNPMVATISTRGSSEGLLGVLVAGLLCAVLERRVGLAGALLGLGVHFKIYPFIYAPAIVWWMDEERMSGLSPSRSAPTGTSAPTMKLLERITRFATPERVRLAVVSLGTFVALNIVMYALYGHEFLQHTFLHHVTRIDHRHNFSPYNILLYLTSAAPSLPPDVAGTSGLLGLRIESVAFLPQLLLSCVLIPLVGAKKNLPACMMAQTFAFVAFNKVCTSQYFLWYMIFLPLYLPTSSFLSRPRLGLLALLSWVASQGAWLQQGYELEFLGRSTFVPGLLYASLVFFLVNCWILGVIVGDFDRATPVAGPEEAVTGEGGLLRAQEITAK